MIPQYSLPYKVMYYDTDAGGVVHNLAYLRWVEQARTLMASEMGIDYATLALEQNRHTVLVRHEVDYHAPAFLADDVSINGILEKAEKTSLYFKFEVRRTVNDKLCVTVRQRLALVQMPQGRPIRLPADWLDKVAPAGSA